MPFYQEPASQTNPDRAHQPMVPGGPIREELEQCRPTRFGTKRCSSNRATRAANQRFGEAQVLPQWDEAADVLSARVMPCPCQSTLAASGAPEMQVSPTHPPCGLALLLGASGWGSFSSATQKANVLWQRNKGGWEYLLSCHNGGPCALAATQPPTIGQQVQPRDYSGLHPSSASEPRRPPLLPKSWLCQCQRTSAAQVSLRGNPQPTHPPFWCQRTLAAGAVPEACLSHPPALQLGSSLWGRVRQFVECDNGRQRALGPRGTGGWLGRTKGWAPHFLPGWGAPRRKNCMAAQSASKTPAQAAFAIASSTPPRSLSRSSTSTSFSSPRRATARTKSAPPPEARAGGGDISPSARRTTSETLSTTSPTQPLADETTTMRLSFVRSPPGQPKRFLRSTTGVTCPRRLVSCSKKPG